MNLNYIIILPANIQFLSKLNSLYAYFYYQQEKPCRNRAFPMLKAYFKTVFRDILQHR